MSTDEFRAVTNHLKKKEMKECKKFMYMKNTSDRGNIEIFCGGEDGFCKDCVKNDKHDNKKCECCKTEKLGDDYATADDDSVLCSECSEDRE